MDIEEYKEKLKIMTDEELEKEGQRLFKLGRRGGIGEQTFYWGLKQNMELTKEKMWRTHYD